MTKEQIAAAFNEWMRRFTEEPEKYEAEFRTVGKFLADQAQGQEPSYGQECAAYLESLIDEIQAKEKHGP